jgi:acetyl coenzyme A synthetase (ADP forming)-like protein
VGESTHLPPRFWPVVERQSGTRTRLPCVGQSAVGSSVESCYNRGMSHSAERSEMDRGKNLRFFFNPRSVAVIGASRDSHKLGYGVVRNLHDYHFRGDIYPVNPQATTILGYTCYPSVADLPGPVDLAVVVVPARHVISTVTECGEAGIPAVVVVSGGFSETGPEGASRERQLQETAAQHNIRLLGPNCIGTIDTHTPVNTTFVIGMPRTGDIAFVSQSGAVVAAVIDWARGAGVGFSRIVSMGNGADVNEIELLAEMAADPQSRVITGYLEGVADGRAFLQVASEAARQKPVAMLKVGRGEGGARAVASHTGALAGSAEAYDAALRKAGVLRANSLEELFDWARALAWQPLPSGNRVAVLTNAGGPGILAVDALEAAGLTLAPLTDTTRQYLASRCPPYASVNNPVDILAGSGPGTYARALDALLADETVDATVVIQAPQDWFYPTSLAEVIGEVAAGSRKPVLACVMGLASTTDALNILHRQRIPNYAFPERVASTLAAMLARRRWLETPPEPPSSLLLADREAAREILQKAIDSEAEMLSWEETVRLLEAYDIPTPAAGLAKTAEEAIALANELGYPVALKIASTTITHKSDVGGVEIGLGGAKAVRAAFERILANVRRVRPEATLDGVMIQQMIPPGQEVIVGWKRDPQFGPLMLVGSGGTDVELVRDVAVGIAPLARREAEQMLDRTLVSKRLAGWRGAPPGDREAVVDTLLRLSQMALDLPQIAELEINPLQVLPAQQGAIAVDGRGIL